MDALLDIAAALLPGVNLDRAVRATEGNIHHVLLVPGVAAVRVSRRPSGAAAMPRRVGVLRALASAGLPFQVPEPLTPVTMFGERAAVAVSWVGGTALPKGAGEPGQVAEVLEAVRSVPLEGALLQAVDHRDEGPHWAETIGAVVIPRLPVKWQDEVRRRLDAVLELEPVPDALVHGDLNGSNVHWAEDGKLVGVLDWDNALPGDPALDTALMSWHRWDTVRKAVPAEMYRRARTYDALLGAEHLVACMNGRPMTSPDGFLQAVVPWLEADAESRA